MSHCNVCVVITNEQAQLITMHYYNSKRSEAIIAYVDVVVDVDVDVDILCRIGQTAEQIVTKLGLFR